MTSDDLRAFEREVAEAFEAGKIRAPVHLAGGNEDQLIEIFREIKREDWVFSTWRSHYHALLHGVPRELVMSEILAGRSMQLHFPEHRFFTSAIVGGILPIACGVAAAGAKVWCFVGDMTSTIGTFWDARHFTSARRLPVRFVVENNSLSTNTPTVEAWGEDWGLIGSTDPEAIHVYTYQRTYPHVGSGKFVPF